MACAAYLQENEVLVLFRGGHLHTLFKPLGILFFNEPPGPTAGAFAGLPNKNDKNPTNARRGWACLELTEP